MSHFVLRNTVILLVAVILLSFSNLTLFAQSHPPADETQMVEKPVEKGSEKSPEKANNATESFEKLLQKELETTNVDANQAAPSWAWQILKTTFVLGLLMGVFYLVYRIYVFKRRLPGLHSTALRVLYSFPITQGKTLQIIEMANHLLILGLSEGGINLISEITDRARIEQIKLDCEKDNNQVKPDFFIELSRAVSQKTQTWLGKKEPVSNKSPVKDSEDLWQDSRASTMGRLSKLRTDRNHLRDDENE